MAVREIRRVWTRQPQGTYALRTDLPLCRGLHMAVAAPHSTLNLVTGSIGTPTGPLDTRSSPYGITSGPTNAAYGQGAAWNGDVDKGVGAVARTLALMMVGNGTLQYVRSHILSTWGGHTLGLRERSYGLGWTLTSRTGYVDSSLEIEMSPTSGVAQIVVGTITTSTLRLWINGVAVGTLANAAGALPTMPEALSIFDDVSCLLALMWARELSDGEINDLSANPWQIFEPRRIYVPRSGAGITAPTLLVASAHNITSTSLRPRVTFTR